MDEWDSQLQEAGDDDRPALAVDGLAKEVAVLFQSGGFAECVEVLNQLLAKKGGDPKEEEKMGWGKHMRSTFGTSFLWLVILIYFTQLLSAKVIRNK